MIKPWLIDTYQIQTSPISEIEDYILDRLEGCKLFVKNWGLSNLKRDNINEYIIKKIDSLPIWL